MGGTNAGGLTLAVNFTNDPPYFIWGIIYHFEATRVFYSMINFLPSFSRVTTIQNIKIGTATGQEILR